MGINIVEFIDREIENYCKHRWPNYHHANSTPFNLIDFRNCYIMQLIKESYYEAEPKASLRHYRGTDEDAARMQDSRNIAYAQHYRNLQYHHLLETVGISVHELLPEKVETREEKLRGHKKTVMQYFELNTMAQHPLLKSIISKRICSVKKISNTTFTEYMKDYDDLTRKLAEGLNGDDESVVFSTIALFTLEWKYQVEFFYSCAENAEKNNIADVPQSKIFQLCAHHVQLLIPESKKILNTESRFILNRMKLVPLIYSISPWDVVEEKLYHYLVMKYSFNQILIHHDSLAEHYGMVSTRKQWADFFRNNYDLRSIYKEKEWTNKKIRYVRKLYDTMITEMPTPQ